MSCCQPVKIFCDQCIRWCKNEDDENYKISIENVRSPMIISRSVAFLTTFSRGNSTSDKHSEISSINISGKRPSYSTNLSAEKNIHLKPMTYQPGEIGNNNLLNDTNPTEQMIVNIPIKITHEKLFSNLSIKVSPCKRVSDRFDVHIKGLKNTKPKKLLFQENKIFKKVSENDLKRSSLYFKFYDRRVVNETKRLGEARFRLSTLSEVGLQDNVRYMMTELAVSRHISNTSPGSIELSMRYDLAGKQLIVTFLRGKDFLEDLGNRLNVYCTADFIKNQKKVHSFKTSIQYDTLNPEWNEKFSFPAIQKDLSLNVQLKINVYNDCDSEKLILGKLLFPSFPESPETQHWSRMLWISNESIAMWHPFMPIV